jgi:hypothetical protein
MIWYVLQCLIVRMFQLFRKDSQPRPCVVAPGVQ